MPVAVPQSSMTEWVSEIERSGVKAWCVESCSSTMDLARAHVDELSVGELGLVLARAQSSGRGRRGSQWEAPRGSFAGTWIFPAALAADQLSGLSLVVGIAVKRAATELGADLKLKWPNDLLSTKGEKVAGLLIESLPRGGQTIILIGLGANLLQKPSLQNTAALSDLAGKQISPPTFGSLVSHKLKELLPQFISGGFAPFQREWESSAAFIREKISFQYQGTKRQGVMLGVNKSGHLIVDLDGQEINLVAGDVAHVRSYQ